MRNHKKIEQLDMSDRATQLLKNIGVTTMEQLKALHLDNSRTGKAHTNEAVDEIGRMQIKLYKEEKL